MTALGSAQNYTAELRHRGGGTLYARLDGIAQLSWSRALNQTSEATITLAPRGQGCRAGLDGATAWAHELAVWRDADLVWEGPLLDIEDTGGTVNLVARDVSVWLTKRLIHAEQDSEGEPADLAALAEKIIRDAFAPDDPNVLPHMLVRRAGVTAERYIDAETVMANTDLDALSKLGLDWTVAGRRILLFGRHEPLAYVPPLQAAHFAGPLSLAQAGTGVITRAIAQGGGVRGEAGGVHPVLGLLEELVTTTAESDEDAAVAAAAALYTPALLVGSGGSVPLTARAPVTISQLIPGVALSLSGRGAALSISGHPVQLTKITGTWTPQGETITPAFVELSDRSREALT